MNKQTDMGFGQKIVQFAEGAIGYTNFKELAQERSELKQATSQAQKTALREDMAFNAIMGIGSALSIYAPFEKIGNMGVKRMIKGAVGKEFTFMGKTYLTEHLESKGLIKLLTDYTVTKPIMHSGWTTEINLGTEIEKVMTMDFDHVEKFSVDQSNYLEHIDRILGKQGKSAQSYIQDFQFILKSLNEHSSAQDYDQFRDHLSLLLSSDPQGFRQKGLLQLVTDKRTGGSAYVLNKRILNMFTVKEENVTQRSWSDFFLRRPGITSKIKIRTGGKGMSISPWYKFGFGTREYVNPVEYNRLVREDLYTAAAVKAAAIDLVWSAATIPSSASSSSPPPSSSSSAPPSSAPRYASSSSMTRPSFLST